MSLLIILVLLTITKFTLTCQEVVILKQIDVLDSIENTGNYRFKKEEINKLSSNSIISLLKNLPEITIKSYSLNNQMIQIRGTSVMHSQIYLNGMLLNSPLNGLIDLSSFLILPDNNYNIYNGTNSFKINNGAFGGIININSDECIENKTNIKYAFQTLKNHNVLINNSLNKNTFKISNTLIVQNNENKFKFKNIYVIPNTLQEITEPSKHILYNNFFLITKKSSKVKFSNFFSTNQGQFQPIILNINNNSIERQNSKSYISTLEYLLSIKKVTFFINGGININRSNYELKHYYNEKLVSDFSSRWQTSTNNITTGLYYNLQNNLNLKISINNIRQYGVYNNDEKFIKNEAKLNLTTSYEFRKNKITYATNNIIFKEKLYNLNCITLEKNTSKTFHNLSIANNIRFPTLNELYYKPGGNINLNPEESTGIDYGFEYHNETVYIPYVRINCYHQNIYNWILWQPTQFGYWYANNVRNAKISGLTLTLRKLFSLKKYNFSNEITFSLNYFAGKDKEIIIKHNPYVPMKSITNRFSINYNHNTVNTTVSYYDKRYPFAYSDLYMLPSTFLIDIDFQKLFKLKDNITLSILFKINNLFSKQYFSILWHAFPQRYYEFGINFIYK